jgi:uncharacterized membrane protein
MLRYGVTFITTLLAFGAIDSFWITLVAAPLYKRTLGDMILANFRPAPAILFYLLMIAGIMVFVVPRTPGSQTIATTFLFGALFGLFTYATFDLTNYAVLKPWTLFLTWTDLAWGTFLTGSAAAVGVWGAEAILRRL